jgi:hypothetical protein
VVASLCILIGVLALLRVMTRLELQAASSEARTIERKTIQAAAYMLVHHGRSLLRHAGMHLATLLTKARAGIMQTP